MVWERMYVLHMNAADIIITTIYAAKKFDEKWSRKGKSPRLEQGGVWKLAHSKQI